ncbi:MAG: iron-sulfur cluster assembly protein IscA [Gammaproteobacteria bacterium]|nr:iron-sulfur cluster assembly protein IscA [Gammaproteobacteria bacterium]
MSISLTKAAADHLKDFLAKRGRGGGLRLGVKTTGCSGLSYVVEIFDEVAPGDVVFEHHDIKVAVDGKNLAFLDGTEIDYRQEGLNEGFRFKNPNEKATCGCGESFSV